MHASDMGCEPPLDPPEDAPECPFGNPDCQPLDPCVACIRELMPDDYYEGP